MNAALILSGGSGQRFQSALPKQYHKILGKMVIEYVIEEALQAKKIDCVMIAGAMCPSLAGILKKHPEIKCVPGGKKRNETILNGLHALNELSCERVIILDAVRPLVTSDLMDAYISLIENGQEAVSTVQPITDSLGCLDMHEVDRSRYYLMQSPEAYDFKLLYRHFDPDSPLTEVAHQLPKGLKITLYRDFPENPKLTYPWEKTYIAHALRQRSKHEA
ncbi:MAG: hypothetical protein E7322_11315 [Clostridiales bacterium]|nr:hypothetical protein [Clostridiales bacterium]